MAARSDFYVYMLYRDEEKLHPFYVGKGKGRRFEKSKISKTKNGIKNALMAKCLSAFGHVPGAKIFENLTEAQAFMLEKHMVALYGRVDLKTGVLANMTEGGDGPAGYVFTLEQKDLMREHGIRRAQTPEWREKMGSRKGMPVSQKVRDKMRIARLKQNKPMSQVTRDAANAWARSPEAKTALVLRNKTRVWSLEARQRVSELKTGVVPSEESRAKMSKSQREKKLTEEHKEKIRTASFARWQRYRDQKIS